jgi:UDP-N-acetylglucosamine transferase subunit ALG13
VKALVLGLVGTDHHPFDRMVQWMDAAAIAHRDVHFLVQYGTSRPPLVAEGQDFFSHDRMVDLMASSSVIVCHGGPATITDAREAGHVPLCLPRNPELGEHVDSHQQRFAKLVGEVGVVRDIRSPETFREELATALAQSVPADYVAPLSWPVRDAARAMTALELNNVMVTGPLPRLGRYRHAHP